MSWTLDTLLTNDPESGSDRTGEWEDQCDLRNAPKIKFPLKMLDDKIKEVDLGFQDPIVSEPKPKKKEKKNDSAKVVELTKRKDKNKDKNKLF
jgi:hypothetical protein